MNPFLQFPEPCVGALIGAGFGVIRGDDLIPLAYLPPAVWIQGLDLLGNEIQFAAGRVWSAKILSGPNAQGRLAI